MDIFDYYYCSAYKFVSGIDYQEFLFIKVLADDSHIASVRVYRHDDMITIYCATFKDLHVWNTYAPLIVEYIVNTLKINNIEAIIKIFI